MCMKFLFFNYRPLARRSLLRLYKQRAHLIEHVKRQKDHTKRERIARRCYDGCHYQQCHDGMSPVFAEKFTMQDSCRAQCPSQQWKFEHYAKHENQHQESIHVGIKRNLIRHKLTHLIIGQETQRNRENNKIPYRDTYEKHHISHHKCLSCSAHLIVVQCRLHKIPNEIQHQRERKNQREPKRCAHVYE